jgi:RNA polymerase sigma-70 factor, ECF subfamily
MEPDQISGPANQTSGPAPDSIRALVSKLCAGDNGAAALLDELYRAALVRFCWGYLGTMEEAEDAVQEVFCKIIQSRQVPDHPRPWLYKVARNHCLNVLRDRARRPEAPVPVADALLAGQISGALSRLARQELQSRLAQLVGALPVAEREVLRLRYTEGLARAEIAYVLEIPESVVKSRLFEGLKKLREHTSLLDGR